MNVKFRGEGEKKKVLDLFQEPAQVIMLQMETLSALKN